MFWDILVCLSDFFFYWSMTVEICAQNEESLDRLVSPTHFHCKLLKTKEVTIIRSDFVCNSDSNIFKINEQYQFSHCVCVHTKSSACLGFINFVIQLGSQIRIQNKIYLISLKYFVTFCLLKIKKRPFILHSVWW